MAERVFWDQIDELKRQIRDITPHVVAAPQIVGQPANAVTTSGGTASFAVATVGNPPFTYQWRKDGSDIPNATGAILLIVGAGSGDEGSYSVVITNTAGSVESTNATLRVAVVASDFPIGGIAMWSGAVADIAANYHLCDGTGGTPDMRDRFVIGAASGDDGGGIGGSATHSHSPGTLANAAVSAGTPAGTNSAPTFTGDSRTTSSVSAGTVSGTINNHSELSDAALGGAAVRYTGPTTHSFAGDPLAAHSHTVTATGTVAAPVFTGAALGTHTHALSGKTAVGENGAASVVPRDVYPPWFDVCYIMRMS